MSPRRVAAIDCGTNSIRLLIADAGEPLQEVARELQLVRLGQGVDATGEFHPEALARTFAACDDYAALIAGHRVEQVRFIATSAARDARNREEFFAGVSARLGVVPEVIEGDEEARLSFAGAISGVPATGTVMVFDIGGGSTELVVGAPTGQVHSASSLNIGSVRITERFFDHRPPRPAEVALARDFVRQALASVGVDFAGVATAIGVAGTVTSLAAASLGLRVYDRALVHGSCLSADRIQSISEAWLTHTTNELIEEHHLHPMRAEVLPAGSLILREIAQQLRVPVTVSETDILDGIAQQMLTT